MKNNKLSKIVDYIIDKAWNGGNIKGFHFTIGDSYEIDNKKIKFTEDNYNELIDNIDIDERLYKVNKMGNTISICGRRRIMGEDNKY